MKIFFIFTANINIAPSHKHLQKKMNGLKEKAEGGGVRSHFLRLCA